MGYIYKITNMINGKQYVGQTRNTIQERMRKHFDKAKNQNDLTGIDAAIKKYGKENFAVEELCSCLNEDLDVQERYYIAKYNTFEGEGYNLTPGGNSGSFLNLDENMVICKYKELSSIKETALYFGCCEKTISNILHANNVEIKLKPNENSLANLKLGIGKRVKRVYLVELNKEFSSETACADWLIEEGYSKASSVKMALKSLSRALSGERKTYCGFHFQFVE